MVRVDVHAIRREQILAAVERVLVRKGTVPAATFVDLCKEAAISNGVLTYHFKDKEEILLGVVEKVSQVYQERSSSLLSHEAVPLPDQLAQVVRSYITCTEEQRAQGLLSLHLLSLIAQQPELVQRLASSLQPGLAEIEQAIEHGQTQQRDPAAAAAVIQMLLMGMAVGSFLLDLTVPVEQFMDEVQAMLSCYLGTGDAPFPLKDNET